MNQEGMQQRYTSVTPYIIMGMSDGLIIPLSIAAIFTSTGSAVGSLVGVGLFAALFGAVLTGIGGYRAVHENDFSDEAQKAHAEKNKKLLHAIGIPEHLQDAAGHDVEHESEAWQDIIKNETAPGGRRTVRPPIAGLTIALAYISGGIIVIAPYLFIADMKKAFLLSATISLCLLLVLGYKKYQQAGMKGWQGSLILFFTGLLAAGGAYGIAQLFV